MARRSKQSPNAHDKSVRLTRSNPHMRPLGVPRDDDGATDDLELGTPASHRSIARAQRELDAARKRFKKPYHVAVWEERDRLHIDLQDANDETIIEWWDDEARQAIEDGFLELGRSPRGRQKLLESAVEYATHMGLL